MSLYNVLFGQNKVAPLLLKLAGVKPEEIPRFRDCYAKDGKIVVYTRTGGGNRECYSDNDKHDECYHTLNDALASKPNFFTDYDDEFDSTYAYFEFTPLDEFKELITALESDERSVGEKFETLINKLKAEQT